MDSQEVFDTIVSHLRQQGCVAQDEFSGMCRYRTDDGKKCAVGVLIPDELYSPKMESQTYTQLVNNIDTPQELVVRLSEHGNLLIRMQKVHDKSTTNQWEFEFRKVANDFHLQYNLPQQGTKS